MLKLVTLLTDPEVSHTAWRITRPFNRLREIGIQADYLHNKSWGTPDGVIWNPDIFKGCDFSLANVLILPRVQVGVYYRDDFVNWINELHKDGITVIYETDDDVYSPAWVKHHVDCNPSIPVLIQNEMLNLSVMDRWILNQVDGITTSTEHLSKVLKEYTDKPIVVVPNAIDQELFEKGLTSTEWDTYKTIGWSAGYRPEADALPVAEAWARIYKEFPYVHFVIAGHPQQCLINAVPDSKRRHHIDYLPMFLYPTGMKVDIGCCSAAPTEFNKSRSPGKSWEYSLAGAYPICSSTVYDGVVQSADDWYTYISFLLSHPAELKAGKEIARQDVLEHHTLTKNLRRWTDAYETLVGLQTRTVRV